MDAPFSSRLNFLEYADAHESHVRDLFTDPKVMKHVGNGVLSEENAKSLWNKLRRTPNSKKSGGVWAAESKDEGLFVAHSSIRPLGSDPECFEIGFVLKSDKWGRGYGTEVAQGLVRFAFDIMEQEAVFATVDDDHWASINVLLKAGFAFHRYGYDELGRYSVYRTEP